jgi:hypothetical protein
MYKHEIFCQKYKHKIKARIKNIRIFFPLKFLLDILRFITLRWLSIGKDSLSIDSM